MNAFNAPTSEPDTGSTHAPFVVQAVFSSRSLPYSRLIGFVSGRYFFKKATECVKKKIGWEWEGRECRDDEG